MIDNQELRVADVIWNYFSAVRSKWPVAWDNLGRGAVLGKTNGFRALMRFLRPAYLRLARPGGVPSMQDFLGIFDRVTLRNEDFNIDNFVPGTSGEGALYRRLREDTGLQA